MDNNTVLLLIIAAYFVMQMYKSQKRESFANDSAEVAKCQQCIDDSFTCNAYNDFISNKSDEYQTEIINLNAKITEIQNKKDDLEAVGEFKYQTQALFDEAGHVCSSACANVDGSVNATSFDDANATKLEKVLFSLEDKCNN
jgi:ABC-type transport system involved in cytochrome bd biosynthesis fused ATPase/permease subunit